MTYKKILAEKLAVCVLKHTNKHPFAWTLESMEREILKFLKKEDLSEKSLLRQKRQSNR